MDPIFLPIAPKGKPRMTKSDRWRKRPTVVAYFDWKDTLIELWQKTGQDPPLCFHICFLFTPPVSWSARKKSQFIWTPHQAKPDADNCLKAFQDALMSEDKDVWDVRATKLWADKEGILILPMDPFPMSAAQSLMSAVHPLNCLALHPSKS